MKKSISVAICCDDNFALYGAMALYSAAINLNRDTTLCCYVVDTGMSDVVKRKLTRVFSKENVSLNWITIDAAALNRLPLPEGSWLNQSTYARILLPELLPDTVSRIIYLDSDTIVDDDILYLSRINLSGCVLGACVAPAQSTVEASSSHQILEHLGMKSKSPYFNGGVLLIDVDMWKKTKLTNRALTLIEKEGMNFAYADQDALNILLEKQWLEIDSRWNVPTSSFIAADGEMIPLTQRASIIHFTGSKPGSNKCLHPLRGKFHDVLFRSNWYSFLGFLSWRTRLALGAMHYHGKRTALNVRRRTLRRSKNSPKQPNQQ